jgi:hypothetical protein
LTLKAATAGPHGRAPLFEFPIRLPDAFDLALEVWGDADTLEGTRVVGIPLRAALKAQAAKSSVAAWHAVQIHRDVRGLALRIDGRPIPVREPSLTSWLSVEPPPNQEAWFQKLFLTW